MLQRLVTLAILFSATSIVMANEEPEYEVLQKTSDYEIRRYAEYIVAEVDVNSNMKDASSSAFRILAGYIFGGNDDEKKMNMTAPVESRSVAGSDDASTFAFVMEKSFSMDTLPKPDDPQVRLQKRTQRIMAARRYSGSWSESSYNKHRDKLLAALREAKIEVIGEPVWARYNAPYVPWPLRRNEVMFEVALQSSNVAR